MQFLFPSSLAAFCPALHSHSCCCTAIVNLSLKFRPTKSIYWNEFPPTPTIKPHSGKTASPFIRSICVQPQARNSFCWCGQGNPSIYAMYQGEQKKTFWIQFMFTSPHTISKYLVPSKFPPFISTRVPIQRTMTVHGATALLHPQPTFSHGRSPVDDDDFKK